MVLTKNGEEIGARFDFSEGILSGLRWDAPRNDVLLTVLYAWDEPEGLKDTDVSLRLVDCTSLCLRLEKNIQNAAEYGLSTPWQEVESLLAEPMGDGYRIIISSNMEPDLLVAECREVWIETDKTT